MHKYTVKTSNVRTSAVWTIEREQATPLTYSSDPCTVHIHVYYSHASLLVMEKVHVLKYIITKTAFKTGQHQLKL